MFFRFSNSFSSSDFFVALLFFLVFTFSSEPESAELNLFFFFFDFFDFDLLFLSFFAALLANFVSRFLTCVLTTFSSS